MIQIGYNDGKNAIKKGHGVSAHEAYVQALNIVADDMFGFDGSRIEIPFEPK